MTPAGGEEEREPVTVTDKRRIDPSTGAVREAAAEGGKDSESDSVAAEPDTSGSAAADDSGDAAKVAELTADLQRAHADFANYRKRVERDRQSVIDAAKASVLTQLLGVIDDLERARSHGDLESGPLRSVSDKLSAVFQGLGLTAFGEEGDEFDPSLHEAVQHEGEGGHPVLASVLRKGYKLGERVLRTAMVAVTDADSASEKPQKAAEAAESSGDTVGGEPESADAETQSESEST